MIYKLVKTGTISTYEEGAVYFDSSTHLLKVGTGSNRYITYSGVRSVSYDDETNILTIINQDGDEIEVNTLPVVDSSDNFKILQVVDGSWTLVSPNTIYSGNTAPNNSQGNNGDIYIQS